MEPGKRLLGKVAIVTGGASGIGAATARLFAQHGASVLLTDSNASLGKSIETEIASAGGTASFAEQDVRNEGRWSAIVDQAEKAWGRVDILCNIAGISGRDPKQNIQTGHTAGPRLADQTLEHWNLVMEINATGVFLGTKRRGAGHAARGRRLDHQHLVDLRHRRQPRQRRLPRLKGRCASSPRRRRSSMHPTRSA